MAHAPAELTVVVIDVGPSMCAPQDDGQPYLSKALGAASIYIRNKIIYGKKEEVGIVLFGTQETDNPLQDDGYDNVQVAREIAPPDLTMLRFIEHSVVPGNAEACFLDAIVVAISMLTEAAQKFKKCNTNLVLFTDGGSGFKDPSTVAQITDGLCDLTGVNMIGLFPEDEDEEVDEDSLKGLPEKQQEGLKLLLEMHKVLDEAADDETKPIEYARRFSFRYALDMASTFRKPTVRQTSTCRACLEIADLKIPVWAFVRCTRAKLPSMKKLTGPATEGDDGTVSREVTHHKLDDDETEVTRDDLNKVYKFGSDDIPWAKVDEENMKLETEKMIRLICFVPKSKVPRHYFLGTNVLAMTPPSGDKADPVSAQALSALVLALNNLEHVGIVRYVRAKNAAPKIGMIWPHIRPHYRCLLFVCLPFREDIRHFQFPSLAVNEQLKPTPEQDAYMSEFIDKMDLMDGWINEDGEGVEALQPKHTFNPVIQRFWQCVSFRALNPDEPLPELDPSIASYLQQQERVLKNADPAIKNLQGAFSLRKKEIKGKEKTAARLWQEDGEEDADEATKRARVEPENVESVTLASMLKKKVEHVGSTTPVEDYLEIIADKTTDKLISASKELMAVMEDFLTGYVGGPVDKFVSMLKALREQLLPDEAKLFNEFLTTVKTTMEAGVSLNPVRDAVTKANITLISTDESGSSDTDQATADAFWDVASQSVPMEAEPAPEEDDVDDLMDDL